MTKGNSIMQAIPTTFAGTTFRSRLEADFAAEFDRRGMAWEYEPEGYRLSDGTLYLPDFYLPGCNAWVEVKGAHMQRVTKLEQFAEELWWDAPAQLTADDSAAPLVVLATRSTLDWGSREPRASYIGVRAPGKRYSIALLRCPGKWPHHYTFHPLWASHCRTCQWWEASEERMRAWHETIADPMAQAPRWRPSS